MGIKLTNADFNKIIQDLKNKYQIYGPTKLKGLGSFSDTDLVAYNEISCLEDMVWDEKSRFSPKEIIHPITQTLFYFNQDEVIEPKVDEKKFVIFLRPCDANAILRLDNILLKNGPLVDNYYSCLREKVKFFVIECLNGFENCSCVSMGSNAFLDYDVFLRLEKEDILCDVKSTEFEHIFNTGTGIDFIPEFINKNTLSIQLPDIEKLQRNQTEVFSHKFWEEYDKRCIGCGRCNFSCPTCSCFNMQDIFYQENKACGERRRVWASCMVDGYTEMAGGHSFREKFGQRMRFKTMHKIYDYVKRFGLPMCVGCGRCDDVCPEYISFRAAINKVSHLLGGENNEK
ncbi:MAG: anaerobic sulfite reductase subunit AsrA [Dehalobacterium sp.]